MTLSFNNLIGIGAALMGFFALAIVGGVWAFQTYIVNDFEKSVFSPEDLGLEDHVRRASFIAEDGLELSAWLVEPEAERPTILSFFGSHANAALLAERLKPLMDAGYGLAILEYRGSGGAPGTPKEALLVADATRLYDELDVLMGASIPTERRVIHGLSLGGSIATSLAAQRPIRALVIESGLPSLCEYFSKQIPLLPLCSLMWTERYAAIEKIDRVDAPILIAHGGRDLGIPIASAERLFDAANEPKKLIKYPEGGHANLVEHGFFEDLEKFLKQL